MSAGPCMCGAIDCPSCGPAQGYDPRKVGDGWDRAIEAQRENALDHIVETALFFGRYPQRGGIQFDLYDWMCEKNILDHSDLLEYFILSMGDYSNTGEFEDARTKHSKALETALREHLKDSDIVSEKAEEYAAEELEAA